MNIEAINKWLDKEYGCSYTRLEELHDFYFEKYCDLKKENEQLKETYKEVFNNYQKLKKENEEVTSLNLHQVDKIQQLKEELEEYKNPIKYFKYANKNVTEENKQLKDNWNKLKEYMIKQQTRIVIENTDEDEFVYTDLLNKMQELEGSDSDGQRNSC
jgi:chromosome segregation ATPase